MKGKSTTTVKVVPSNGLFCIQNTCSVKRAGIKLQRRRRRRRHLQALSLCVWKIMPQSESFDYTVSSSVLCSDFMSREAQASVCLYFMLYRIMTIFNQTTTKKITIAQISEERSGDNKRPP